MKVTYKIRKMSGNKESITIDPCTLEQLTALFENELIGEVLVTREVEELTPIEWLTENMPQISQYIPLAISLELHSKVQIARQMERDIIKANTLHQDSSTEPLITKVKAFNHEIDSKAMKEIYEIVKKTKNKPDFRLRSYIDIGNIVSAAMYSHQSINTPLPNNKHGNTRQN